MLNKVIHYDSIPSFCSALVQEYYNSRKTDSDFSGAYVIAKYGAMIGIFNTLVKGTDFRMYDIYIEDPYVSGFDGEFLLSIDLDGDILIERLTAFAKDDLYDEELVFVDLGSVGCLEDYSYRVFAIGDEDGGNGCGKCGGTESRGETADVSGTYEKAGTRQGDCEKTAGNGKDSHSGNAGKFDDEFCKTIKKSILDYCEAMDRFNDILFWL